MVYDDVHKMIMCVIPKVGYHSQVVANKFFAVLSVPVKTARKSDWKATFDKCANSLKVFDFFFWKLTLVIPSFAFSQCFCQKNSLSHVWVEFALHNTCAKKIALVGAKKCVETALEVGFPLNRIFKISLLAWKLFIIIRKLNCFCLSQTLFA